MNTVKQLILGGLLALTSLGAAADFLKTDWLSNGDSLAVLDQATGKEWLSLTQTKNMSFDSVQALLGSSLHHLCRLALPDTR